MVESLKEKSSFLDIKIKPLFVDYEKLFEYDTSVFGVCRCDFLKQWITIPESLGWVAIKNKGDIIGYIVIQCGVLEKHQVVGPLFADDAHIARNRNPRILLHTAAEASIDRKSGSFVLPTYMGVILMQLTLLKTSWRARMN